MALSRDQRGLFERLGAQARIKELQAEIASIRRAFGAGITAAVGELKRGFVGRRGRTSGRRPERPRRKGQLSAAGRAAISKAQKLRWAKLKAKKVKGAR